MRRCRWGIGESIADCKLQMGMDWRQAAGRMRAELDRAALNERPRLVVAVLIKATLMRERVRVVLPDREALCALLGIGKQHMAGVWRELDACGICRFRAVAGGWEAIVQPDSRLWTVDWVYERDALDAFLAFVDRLPGQSQSELLPAEPNLAEEVAKVGVPKLGTAVPSSGTPCKPVTVTGSKPVRFEPLKRTGERGREWELMDRCREVFGAENMSAYGGVWRLRARENPGKLERVLAETAAAVREGRVRTVAGAYANDAWGRFE